MKVFWGIIAALTILTLVLLVGRGAHAPVASEPAPVEPLTAAPPAFTPPAAPEPAAEKSPEVMEPEGVIVERPNGVSELDARRTPVDVLGDLDRAIGELTGIPQSPTPRTEPAKPADAGSAVPATPPAPSVTPDGQPTPVKLDQVEDGWTRVDDRFMIRGSGTAADPYVIPWDILVSAAESYRPRLGKRVLPERINMLNGKHVRLTGFLLFPMFTSTADELLIMRNQWDGCCIGIPPTPYDAVEVKVTQPVERRDMFVQYATIEGVMKVEPYVNRDWLLGLYIIENARVVRMTDEGVQRPDHAPGDHPGSAP